MGDFKGYLRGVLGFMVVVMSEGCRSQLRLPGLWHGWEIVSVCRNDNALLEIWVYKVVPLVVTLFLHARMFFSVLGYFKIKKQSFQNWGSSTSFYTFFECVSNIFRTTFDSSCMGKWVPRLDTRCTYFIFCIIWRQIKYTSILTWCETCATACECLCIYWNISFNK